MRAASPNVNILLVEDNPGDVRLLAEMLKDTAFADAALHTAATLQEAMAAPLEPMSVAMVLLDLNLPDSNGIDTLHSLLGPFATSAIIVLTGLNDERLAVEALRNGAQNYLTKGHIEPGQLERELRYAVERHGFVMRLREADEELVARERRFRSLVEHSSELTLMVDTAGKVTYASPAVHRLYGYIPYGMNAFSVLVPDDVLSAEECLKTALAHPERPVPLVVRTSTREAGKYTLEGYITNLTHFQGVGAIVVNLHDVTARVKALEEVVYERNAKKALINSSTDMIWSVDRNYEIITANRSFVKRVRELSGYEVEPGRTIVPPIKFGTYDSDTWKKYYNRALDGNSFVVEGHSDGPDPVWGEFTFNPILEGDRITGVACSCRDVTERKRSEQHVRKLNAELEQRVAERTEQLMAANHDLESEMVKNRGLTDMLGVKNRDLMDSMTYARRIQDALFPTAESIGGFRASALLSLPRDVVSGDFVWHYETPERIHFALCDCTGHGVPGALMSMLGHTLLDQLMVERRLGDPGEVLTEMDRTLNTLFSKHSGEERVNDGMDIGLFMLDKKTETLYYAGAMIRCAIVRDRVLHQLDAVRAPIGGHLWTGPKRFEVWPFKLEKGDRIIICSDGYQSQFGGPENKKFNGAQLRSLFEQTAGMPAQKALNILEARFHAWKGSGEQVDDVLVAMLDV